MDPSPHAKGKKTLACTAIAALLVAAIGLTAAMYRHWFWYRSADFGSLVDHGGIELGEAGGGHRALS